MWSCLLAVRISDSKTCWDWLIFYGSWGRKARRMCKRIYAVNVRIFMPILLRAWVNGRFLSALMARLSHLPSQHKVRRCLDIG